MSEFILPFLSFFICVSYDITFPNFITWEHFSPQYTMEQKYVLSQSIKANIFNIKAYRSVYFNSILCTMEQKYVLTQSIKANIFNFKAYISIPTVYNAKEICPHSIYNGKHFQY